MKRTVLFLLFIISFSGALKAQYTTPFVVGPNLIYIYVGSLNKSESDLSNADKLQVEVFGGGWGAIDIGVTTYYIANRDGLNIHQVTLGGPNNGFYSLQAYDNGSSNIDFYIVSASWTAIAVKSCILNGTTPVNQTITNTVTTSVPGTLHAINPLPILITDDNGNIGIKTNIIDPDYALTVNGGIHSKQVVVDIVGFPDYVFRSDYKIRPLSEIQTYIDQNHHLPDMPSAAEVEKDGLNLGEMNKLLTKKVEELTLYLIEKDRQLQVQKDKQALQDKKIETILNRLNKFENQQR